MGITFGKEFSIAAAVTDPAIKRHLLAMELNGNESVNSGFVSPNAHNLSGRSESEEAEASNMAMQFLAQLEQEVRERVDALNERLNRLEEKTYESFMRTEEELRAARAELQTLRDNAHQAAFPDGSVQRVYRDGEVVRLEDGTEVDPRIVRAEDMPTESSRFDELTDRFDNVDRLSEKRNRDIETLEKLDDIRERTNNNPTSDDLDELENLVDQLDASAAPIQERVQSFNATAEKSPREITPENPQSQSKPDFAP